MTGPCCYGTWDYNKQECQELTEPNEFGQRFCKRYKHIVENEKHSKMAMMGCGCSSTLFNTTRQNVIDKLKEKENE